MIHTESLTRAPAREERQLSNSVPADQLRSIVERVERLDAEIKDLNADKASIYKEAKSNGLHVKALQQIVKIRAADPAKRAEERAILELYADAIGVAV